MRIVVTIDGMPDDAEVDFPSLEARVTSYVEDDLYAELEDAGFEDTELDVSVIVE